MEYLWPLRYQKLCHSPLIRTTAVLAIPFFLIGLFCNTQEVCDHQQALIPLKENQNELKTNNEFLY